MSTTPLPPPSPCPASRICIHPLEVITKMADNLQPPEPDRFPWERYTVVIRSEQVLELKSSPTVYSNENNSKDSNSNNSNNSDHNGSNNYTIYDKNDVHTNDISNRMGEGVSTFLGGDASMTACSGDKVTTMQAFWDVVIAAAGDPVPPLVIDRSAASDERKVTTDTISFDKI